LPGRRHSAELAEAKCTIAAKQTTTGTLLDLGELGSYAWDELTRDTAVLIPPVNQNDLALVLSGPVLLHSLAHDGIHVLHASASALPDGRAIALTAGSGTGKSTFAATALAHGWQRLADDLLPLTRDGDAWVARPHLAQPKLADDEQYPADAPRDVPLAAIVELARGDAARWDDYDAGTVTRLLLAGTVATRTYTAPMLAAHLDFCAAAGRAVTARQLVAGRLTVADRPDAIAEAVDEALGLLAARIAHSVTSATPD
jgi:hypothetical protein